MFGVAATVAGFLIERARAWVNGAVPGASLLTGAPSNASAGAATSAVPNIKATMVRSNVHIALFLVGTARLGYGPSHRRPNMLGIFPDTPRSLIRLAGSPPGFTFRKL